MVRRKHRLLVLGEHILRRRARLVGLGAAGAAVLLLAFSLVRAYWEAPTDRSTAISGPSAASSPGPGPDEPRAASAEAPALGHAPEPGPAIEDPGGGQGASPRAASRAEADPAPPDASALLVAARRALDVSSPQRRSGEPPLAAAPRSRSPEDMTASGERISGKHPGEFPASSPRTADRPQAPVSRATPNAPGDAFSSVARPAPTAGEIRVFIHHVAGRDGDADLAQRLASHLEGRGFTVADIRPVGFSIGKPSVRYFFEADRSASEGLVDEVESFLDAAAARSPDHASDFTHFTPKPRPGNVEVWLAGARDDAPAVPSRSEIGAAAPMPER